MSSSRRAASVGSSCWTPPPPHYYWLAVTRSPGNHRRPANLVPRLAHRSPAIGIGPIHLASDSRAALQQTPRPFAFLASRFALDLSLKAQHQLLSLGATPPFLPTFSVTALPSVAPVIVVASIR